MARPAKYNWELIDRDYIAGVSKAEIRRKYGIPRNTLDNRIREENLQINNHAVEAMSHLGAVSGHLGAIAQKHPEILENVANRISTESEFNLLLDDVVVTALKVNREILKAGKVTTQTSNNIGDVIELERSLTPTDIKSSVDAAYRAKEVKYGKEFPSQPAQEERPQERQRIEIVPRSKA